jgi:Zn-dependent M16 (insulinase) family peptidase
MKEGGQIDGFSVQRVTPLPNLRSVAYQFRHEASGARILHLVNEDPENLFSVSFPTPPPDDTGVPHILEHSVLAGSAKYRVKDPFFEMVKSSMATFINAMTGSDYTVYPVASNVRQDFFNLAEVYWDAVFHPLLTEQTFQREGHHLEITDTGELIIKGIVYNEMKGAKSSPEAKVWDLIEKNLWPDTPYGKDAGGDPDHIPDLTWQGLRNFHQTFYHPSNAFIFLYGDIPTADHLKFLSTRLAKFQKTDVRLNLDSQPRWKTPRSVAGAYPIAPTDAVEGKTYVVLNWLVGNGTDPAEVFALGTLERILLGNQAAPLRKAIIDSKLGQDLTHSGASVNGPDASFHIGIKGTDPDRAKDFENLIVTTLKKIAAEGVSPDRFDAAIQQLQYKHLEITPSYPLHLMSGAFAMWLHKADPLEMFRAEEHIANLKRQFAADPDLFGKIIRDRLLNNPHRLTVIAKPDREIQAKKDAEFAEKMKKEQAALSPAQIADIKKNQAELEAILNAPNSPEAIASLPQLRVADLPPKPKHIPTKLEKLPGGAILLNNDVFANGVNYLLVSFDLSGLPPELIPYVALYSDAVQKMGAAGQDFVKMAERIAAYTGGIAFSAAFHNRVDVPDQVLRTGTFSIKFLDDHADAALSVLTDLMLALDPGDVPRLKDILLQARAAQRMRPQHDGMGIALRHAAAGFTREAYLNEIASGLPLIRLYEKITDGPPEQVVATLGRVRECLLSSPQITASFTGTAKVLDLVRKKLGSWTDQVNGKHKGKTPADITPVPSLPRTGLAAPMNVAYCTAAMPAPHISHPDAPLLSVASRLLSLNYVLEEVRFKGTAYGGGCGYNGSSQLFAFHSYRDPWINRTLDVYANSLAHVRETDWTQGDVDRSIIGTAKEGEKPIRPPLPAGTALLRHLTGDTPQRREARHSAMLSSTLTGTKRILMEQFETHAAQTKICVVSSREKLEEANQDRPEKPLELEDILPQ